MRSTVSNWRGQRYLSPRQAAIIAAVSLLAVFLILSSLGVENAASNFDLRLLFTTRSKLGKNPNWDPKLKVFAYDDLAVSLLQKSEPPAGILAETLRAIKAQKPKAILIDKMFSYRLEGDVEKLKAAIGEVPPIYTSASFSDSAIPHRNPISNEVLINQSSGWRVSEADWIPNATFAYGANATYGSAFTKVGHLNLAKAERIQPVVRVGEALLPHWALRWWDQAELNPSGITSSWGQIPVTGNGTTLVNLVPLEVFGKKARSIAAVFSRIQKNAPIDEIEEGDIVALVMGLYSGKETYIRTAIGSLPRSYLNIATLNSALSDQWIHEFDHPILASLGAGALALLTAFFLRGLLFWASAGLFSLFWIGFALSLFAYGSTTLPLLAPVVSYVLCGGTYFALNMVAGEKRVRSLKQSLEGLVEPEKLKQLIRNSNDIQWQPRLQQLSVMFVDIVGFSKSAERKDPREVFLNLRSFLEKASHVVHEHNGIIDKTLGDGLLAFFGYEFDGSSSNDHADNAVQCAVALQQMALEYALECVAVKAPVYPLRIGIHTEEVFIGDLGGANRVDFSIVGQGVNFAQRCEAACESFRVIFSDATKKSLKRGFDSTFKLHERAIQIKHHDEAFAVWELEPLEENRTQVQQVIRHHRQQIGLEREESRFTLRQSLEAHFKANDIQAEILNFSRSGFLLFTSGYLGVKSRLQLRTPHLQKMGNSFPQLLDVEIRWGQPHRDGYIHGVRILNLNDNEKNALFETLASSNPSLAGVG